MAKIKIPDLGGADGAQVIEVLVAVGEDVIEDQALVTLEGDKATMEVPATAAGKITSICLAVGDTVKSGDDCLELASEPQQVSKSATQEITVPDLGGANGAQVIEVLVAVGDAVQEDQALITLEGDKATMEVPSPYAGVLVSVMPKVGDKVAEGDLLATITTELTEASAEVVPSIAKLEVVEAKPVIAAVLQAPSNKMVYASPSVRRYAAYYGVDLTRVQGSAENGRILKTDVSNAIIALVAQAQSGTVQKPSSQPKLALEKLGSHEVIELTKIKQFSGKFLTGSWQNIPHVTQQDSADITELEAYRYSLKADGVKISPLIFMMKAVAKVLKGHPNFNSSLSDDGSKLYLKQEINIGVAVDTPKGLVVPVIKNVTEKSLIELMTEVVTIAEKARTKGLSPNEMQGGGFTISSLGGIGGGHFTPIINAPEVAILGISKLTTTPVWRDESWLPRKSLPLSLSYDHRVIDGAEGARFITDLVLCLQDPKQACFIVKN